MVKKHKQVTKEMELNDFVKEIKMIKEVKRKRIINKDEKLKNLVDINYNKDCVFISKIKEFIKFNKVKSKILGRNRF